MCNIPDGYIDKERVEEYLDNMQTRLELLIAHCIRCMKVDIGTLTDLSSRSPLRPMMSDEEIGQLAIRLIDRQVGLIHPPNQSKTASGSQSSSE